MTSAPTPVTPSVIPVPGPGGWDWGHYTISLTIIICRGTWWQCCPFCLSFRGPSSSFSSLETGPSSKHSLPTEASSVTSSCQLSRLSWDFSISWFILVVAAYLMATFVRTPRSSRVWQGVTSRSMMNSPSISPEETLWWRLCQPSSASRLRSGHY